VVTHSAARHALTDRLDHAGALVADHGGERPWTITRHRMQVGMAQAACRQPDEHLTSLRLGQLDVVDHQGFLDCDENCRFDLHAFPTLVCNHYRRGGKRTIALMRGMRFERDAVRLARLK